MSLSREPVLYENARGKHYDGNLHYIRDKKSTKSQSIVQATKTDTAPSANLNIDTTLRRDKPKKKRGSSQQKVDSALLKSIFANS